MGAPLHIYHLRNSIWQRFSDVTNNPAPHLWIGATVITGGKNDMATWQQGNAIIGPLTCRRTYVPLVTLTTFPTSITQTDAGADVTAGLHPFLSIKADPAAVANGDFDGVIGQLAASFPTSSKCWLTYYHEPEDNMTAAEFVPAFQRFYSVAKAANSNISIGPIAMTWQWRVSSTTTSTPDDWWLGDGCCDFLGTDTYWDASRGSTPLGLDKDPDHQRWHNWARSKNKPLVIAERGITDIPDSQRAAMMLSDETWLKANGYEAILWWDVADDEINDQPASANAWQQIALRGRTS
jgi:hypothetical protein